VLKTFKQRNVSLFLLDLNGGADNVSGNRIAKLFLTRVTKVGKHSCASHLQLHLGHLRSVIGI